MSTNNKNAKVISFINMKGGVGKTTLTINIGDKLSKRNKKVLIIDMDPQFNATQSLLLYKVKQTSTCSEELSTTNLDEKIVMDEISSTEYYKRLSEDKKTVLQMFESPNLTKPRDNICEEIKNNLFLIPGDLQLSKEITGDTSNKVGAVYKFLNDNNILNDYDYVLIDCPPTWSILTHSSLVASDYYVIPSKVDLYSSIGIKLLEEQIHAKIYSDSMYQLSNRKLKQLGVIFTLVHRTVKAENSRIAHLKAKFPDISFFSNNFPHIPSAPTKFIMVDEVYNHSNYAELVNSIEKISEEILSKIQKGAKNNE